MTTENLLKICVYLSMIVSLIYSIHIFYKLIYLSPQNIAANDYSHFYTSGIMTKNGYGKKLYDQTIFNEFLSQTSFPYPRPRLVYRSLPFVSMLFAPLTVFSYPISYYAHLLLSVTLLTFSCFVLYIIYPHISNFRLWFLIPFLLSPTTTTLAQGQTSILFLAILILTIIGLKRNKPLLSGLIFSLLLLKPHIFLILGSFIIILVRQKKFFVGIVIGTATLLSTSLIISGTKAIINYPLYIIQTETPTLGSYPQNYGSLASLLQRFIPSSVTNYINLLMLVISLFLFMKYSPHLPQQTNYSIAILIATPLALHVPLYEYTPIIIPMFWLLSQAFVCVKNRLLYFSFFSLLFVIFILGWVANLKPIIALVSTSIGFFLLIFSDTTQIPKFFPPRHVSKP